MNSAVKAAILSAVLVAAIVLVYVLVIAPEDSVVPRGPSPGALQGAVATGAAGEDPAGPETGSDLVAIPDRGSVSVHVEVVGKESGRALPLSRLRVLHRGDGDNTGTLVASLPRPGQRGGNFSLQLEPGVFVLQVRCRGYSGDEMKLTLVPDQEPEEVTFELGRGNTISGHVYTAAGEPLGGAEVFALEELASPDADLEDMLIGMIDLQNLTQQTVHASATSGPDGYYEVGGLENRWYTVRAIATGRSPAERKAPAPSERVDLRLVVGSEFGGRVVDATAGGRPIAGAVVRAYPEIEGGGLFDVIMSKTRPAVGEATTDASGTFALETLGPGTYNFAVKASGYQEFTEMKVHLGPGDNPPKTFSLQPGFTIRGLVRGPDEEPVVGAVVKATPVGGSAGRRDQVYISFDDGSVKTDAQGAFVFDTLKDGRYLVLVWHPSYQSVQRKDVRPSLDEIVIKLDRGGQMEGVVVDTESGSPVAGVTVSVSDVANFRKEAVSDDDGRYFVGGLNSGGRNLTVNVKAPGYARERRQVRVPEGRRVEENFELRRTATVEGRVVFASGDPAPGARVEVKRADEASGSERIAGFAHSDREGNFSVEDVEPGNSLRIRVKLKTYLDAFSPPFPLESGQTVQAEDIHLQLGGEVQGIVRGDAGQAVVGCMVTARAAADTDVSASGTSVQTGADGGYLLRGLETGYVDLTFKASGYVEQVKSGIEVREGQRNTGQDVVLETAGKIAGIVVDTSGQPVSGAEVRVQDFTEGLKEFRSVSDQAGRFQVSGIASKELVGVEVSHEEYGNWSDERVAVGSADLRVVLEPLGRIVGRAVDESGAPVASFTVQPQVSGGADPRNRPRAKTFNTVDGKFDYAGLADGTYTVHVRSPRYAATSVMDVEVRAGRNSDVGDVVLQAGGQVTGRVAVAGTGTPVSGARVRIVQGITRFVDRRASTSKPVQVTGRDGSFSFSGLKDGTLTLEVTHNEFVAKRLPDVNTQVPEKSRDLLIELEHGGEVVGLVQDAGGKPMNGMQVYLMSRGGGSGNNRTTSSNATGEFVFRGVAPGNYLIKAHKFPTPGSGQRPMLAEQEIGVEAGGSLDVVLQVRER